MPNTINIKRMQELTNPSAPPAQQVKETFYPVTHEKAVRDDNGTTLESKLQDIEVNTQAAIDAGIADMEDLVENSALRYDEAQTLTDAQKAQALANVGISGIDSTPTAGSKNLVTSGGVFNSVNELSKETSVVLLDRDNAYKVENKYINSLGNISDASYYKCYYFDNTSGRITNIKATLASAANNQKFVGYYSSLTPSSSTLLGGVDSVVSDSYLVEDSVPEGCKLIVINNNKTIIPEPNIELTWKSEQVERIEEAESDIESLKTEDSNLRGEIENIKDISAITGTSGYYITAQGALAQASNYSSTYETKNGQAVIKYIPVKEGDIIRYNGTTTLSAKAIIGVDLEKKNPVVLLDNPTYGTRHDIVINSTTKYIAICYRNTEQSDIAIVSGYRFADKKIEADVEYLVGKVLCIDDADDIKGKYVDARGDLQNASTYASYWYFNEGEDILEVKATLASATPNKYSVAYYSSLVPSSSTFISGVESVESSSKEITSIPPVGCKLVIVFNKKTELASPTISITVQGKVGKVEDYNKVDYEYYATLEDNGIVTNVDVGETVDISDTVNGFSHCIIQCKKGDYFKIKGHGANNPRLWAFTDGDYKLISKSANGAIVSETELLLTAESDGYLIYNTYTHTQPEYYVHAIQDKGETVQEVLPPLRLQVDELYNKPTQVYDEIDFNLDLNGDYDSFNRPLSWDTDCEGLIDKWDDMIEATVGWTKNDTTTDTSLETPSYSPCPVYIYKHIAKKAYTDNSKHLKVLIYCGEHANEVEGHYVLLDLMRKITTDWVSDKNCELACSLVDFYVIPCLNPWGFKTSRVNYNGVNINRNYASSDWKLRPQGENYGGASAASEFETKTIQWYVDNIKPHITISIHTGNTNSHGAIGSVEYSIDDIDKDLQSCINYATTITRTTSNMLIKSNNNYAQDLTCCLINANTYLRSDINKRAQSSEVEAYTGLCHFYAVEHGVMFPMLIELNSGSDWSNGVYTPGADEKSDITYRGNLIHLSNLLYRCIKSAYKLVK